MPKAPGLLLGGLQGIGLIVMKILPLAHEVNGGIALLSASPVLNLLTSALAAQSAPTQKAFTSGLTPSLRRTPNGWSATELRYTAIQPTGRGRPRALDFFHTPSRVALELELSNQTCFSHDLLKLEVAFRSSLISCGAIMTVTRAAARALKWKHSGNNSYLTYEGAEEFLRIFGPVLTVPIALLGLEI